MSVLLRSTVPTDDRTEIRSYRSVAVRCSEEDEASEQAHKTASGKALDIRIQWHADCYNTGWRTNELETIEMSASPVAPAPPAVAEPEADATDRRQARRLPPEDVPGLGSVTLYPRDPADLVNISTSGVLLSCTRPLSPRASTQLVLHGSGGEQVVAPAQRREHERVQGPFFGTWLRPGENEPLAIGDISEGGCFVQQSNAFSQGDQLALSLALPTGQEVEVRGEVLGADPALGFAMRFVDVSAEAQAALRDSVAYVLAEEEPSPGDDGPTLVNDW